MKRVLIVAADGLTKSGVPNVFMSIINGLHSKEYIFDVLYFDEENAFYKNKINSFGGKAIFCPIDLEKTTRIKKLRTKFRYKNVIKRVIHENGPYDIVHSFKGFESGYILKAAKELKIPIRIAQMAFLYKKTKNFFINIIERHEKRLTEKSSTTIICDSENTKRNNISPKANTCCIYPGVDCSKFSYADLESYVKPISLIQIGSYCFNKNQYFSLEILKTLRLKYPDSTLNFVGFRNPDDFEHLDKIKTFIKEENMENNVHFYDFDSDIPKLFKKCHFLLFPSHFESFGIVPVEAQMCGLYCFCSDSIPKENDCGGCKYLPLGNASIWADEIIKQFKTNQGKHSIFDCSEFSEDKIIKEYELIYQGVER